MGHQLVLIPGPDTVIFTALYYMGLFGEQSEPEKKAEAFGGTWPGRIMGTILLIGFAWVIYSLIVDFPTNTKFIASVITAVILFVGLQLVKRFRG